MVLRNKSSVPKKTTLSELFQEFMTEPVKQYVFNRIPRRMLLEVALCVLQDIASKGVSRAKTLQLEVVKTSAGGKTFAIANQHSERPEDSAANSVQAEDANFRFADNTDKTPDVAFSIGKSHCPPYEKPDKQGYFPPPTRARKSLTAEFAVEKNKVRHKTVPTVLTIVTNQ